MLIHTCLSLSSSSPKTCLSSNSGCSLLLDHLLKWEYQPDKRSWSCLATIRIQKRDILKLLNDNSSLWSYVVV
ncbi:DUF29 family protein [Trichormus azollae]|uniref:DUF29 family protein n=1 Tax=Trichormus azollae TaxID=1164 RepID=UPI00325DF6B0